MEWSIKNRPDVPPVPVPDEVLEAVLDCIDVPRGSFGLDRYRDYEAAGERLRALAQSLETAIDHRRRSIQQSVLERLQLSQPEPWAEPTTRLTEQSDALLSTLASLHGLCEAGIAASCTISIFGD